MEWLIQHPAWFLTCVGILGLLIGSFLNVVIYRLPVMLKREWTAQCHEFLQENAPAENTVVHPGPSAHERFNLVLPASHCPVCKHQITALENIPVLSYLALRGRCSQCRTSISPRYPIIEIISALLSVITAYHFGFSWQCLYALILTWSLIAMAVIDIDHQMLPDQITLPLLWLGLLINLNGLITSIDHAVIGAVVGYLFLWSIYWLFKLCTGKEGMGYGDFKLLAMFGAWLGYQALPFVILFASITGAIYGIALILTKRQERSQPISFGPFLAIAGWLALLWNTAFTHWYTVHFF